MSREQANRLASACETACDIWASAGDNEHAVRLLQHPTFAALWLAMVVIADTLRCDCPDCFKEVEAGLSAVEKSLRLLMRRCERRVTDPTEPDETAFAS